MLRTPVLPRVMSDDEIAGALKQLGLPHDSVASMIIELTDATFWTDLGTAHHVHDLLHNMLTDTFFTFEGADGITATLGGTAAGSQLGDFLLIIAITRVLARVRIAMTKANLLLVLEATPEIHDIVPSHTDSSLIAAEVACVDDGSFPLYAGEARRIIPMTQKAAEIARDHFAKCNMPLNFKTRQKRCHDHIQGPPQLNLQKTASQGRTKPNHTTGQQRIPGNHSAHRHDVQTHGRHARHPPHNSL